MPTEPSPDWVPEPGDLLIPTPTPEDAAGRVYVGPFADLWCLVPVERDKPGYAIGAPQLWPPSSVRERFKLAPKPASQFDRAIDILDEAVTAIRKLLA